MILSRFISGIILAGLMIVMPLQAAGQQGPDAGGESDSTKARLLKPVWSFRTASGKMDASIGSRLNMVVNPGNGMLLNTRIDLQKKTYKTREMTDITQNLAIAGVKNAPGVYILTLNLSHDYRSTQSVSIARFGKDIVYEDKRISASLQYLPPLLQAKSSKLRVYGEYVEGQHDFKYDEKFSMQVSGLLTYGIGDYITVSGSYGKQASTENSTVSYLYYESMPTSIDTLTFNSGYRKNDKEYLNLSFRKTEGEINRVEPPRGNALQVIDNPELAQKDIIKLYSENLTLESGYQPTAGLTLKVDFEHSVKDDKYLVDERLSKRQETDDLSARTEYKFSDAGIATVSVSTRKTDVDYGPTSVSAYKEEEDRIMLNASQNLREDLKVTLKGQTYLKQRYYKKYEENPRDVDNLYLGGGASLEARPFGVLETSVEMEGSRYDIVNIDASLSGDNRTRYIYRMLPTIIFNPWEWLSLTQRYEVKIEYTEYTFDEDRNYIDRTTGVETDAGVMFPGKKVGFNFNHRYNMRDTGSYLSVSGEEKYNRTSEDFRHEFRLKLDYRPVDFLTFSTHNTLRFRKNNSLGVEDGRRVITNSRIYESGTLYIGVKGERDVMLGAGLSLDLFYVRNFGARITKEMKEYVDAKMSVSYEF